MERRTQTEHFLPQDIKELEPFERKHHLRLTNAEGKMVGFAELVHFGKPVKAYYLEYMTISDEFRGQKFGSDLIEQVNDFIRKRGTMGILVNAIEEDQAAHGMYLSHGWKETQIPDLLVYNAPPSVTRGEIRALLSRIENWTDRVFEQSEARDQKAA